MALFDNDSAEMQNLGLVKKLAHNEKHERDEAVETLNTFLCGKRAEEYEDQEDGILTNKPCSFLPLALSILGTKFAWQKNI